MANEVPEFRCDQEGCDKLVAWNVQQYRDLFDQGFGKACQWFTQVEVAQLRNCSVRWLQQLEHEQNPKRPVRLTNGRYPSCQLMKWLGGRVSY